MIEAIRSAKPATVSDRIGWLGLTVVAVGVGGVMLYTLRSLLFARADVLPGTDASNLYAWELYTRTVLASGRLPHWNPYLFSGTPHLADTETTVLYPPAVLLRWIPPAAYLSWMAALHMWIGGVGTAVLGRVIGLGWWPVAGAAIAVSLGGSVPGWLFNGHLLLLYGTSWLPWVLAFVLLSARRRSPWPHPGLVAVLALQFLAGYLQGSVYVVAAAAAATLWLVVWPPGDARGVTRWLPAAQLALGGLLAAGAVAFQLLPTLSLIGQAGRTSGVPYSTAVRGAWTIHDIATFLFPFSGIPDTTPMRYMGDHTAYVGWVLAMLAPVALISRRHRRAAVFFGALAVGSMAFVMADPLPFYRLHFLLFPGLRIPGRMLFVTTLAVAVLGAIGLERLHEVLSRRHRVVGSVVLVLLVGAVAADLAAYSSGGAQPTSPQPAPATFKVPSSPTGRSLSVCDRAMGAMDLLIAGRPAADGAGGVFLSDYGSFQELAQQDGPLRMRRDLLDLVNVTTVVSCAPLHEAGLRQIDQADVGILYHNESAWPRGTWTCPGARVTRREAIEHLRRIQYDARRRLDRRLFVNIRWMGAVDEARRLALESRYHLAEGVAQGGNTWRYDLQDRSGANVRALLTDSAVEDTHGIDRETGDVTAAAGDADQVLFGMGECDRAGAVTDLRADQPGGDVRLVSSAPVAGMVFLSEPYYPERVAYVDGVAVTALKADVAFIAVPVPAGRHTVEIRYAPRRFQQGLAIALVTMVGWFVAAVWLPGARRRFSTTQTAA